MCCVAGGSFPIGILSLDSSGGAGRTTRRTFPPTYCISYLFQPCGAATFSTARASRRGGAAAPPPLCAKAPPHRQQQTNAVNKNSLPRLFIIVYTSLASDTQ